MLEYIMLNVIVRIAMHYIKNGKNIESYATIAEIALSVAAKNEMEKL
nr:hypothetical protein [uncultured Dysosmobacter sp.]